MPQVAQAFSERIAGAPPLRPESHPASATGVASKRARSAAPRRRRGGARPRRPPGSRVLTHRAAPAHDAQKRSPAWAESVRSSRFDTAARSTSSASSARPSRASTTRPAPRPGGHQPARGQQCGGARRVAPHVHREPRGGRLPLAQRVEPLDRAQRPSTRISTRSATRSTSASRCEHSSTVRPSRRSCCTSVRNSHVACGSRLAVGLVEHQHVGVAEQGPAPATGAGCSRPTVRSRAAPSSNRGPRARARGQSSRAGGRAARRRTQAPRPPCVRAGTRRCGT